jgi:hypothetical protein
MTAEDVTPFDALPPDVRKALVDWECMEGEGRPKGKSCAPWQAERFLRVLSAENLERHLDAMRKDSE